MIACPYCPGNPKFTNEGFRVHMGKLHKDKLLRPCPVPGCTEKVRDVRAHAEDNHPEWKLGDGRFVWEVLDEPGGS